MRILHLDAGSEMRGGQWQVLRLIEGLAEAGVESVLLARPGSPLYQRMRAKGLRVEVWGLASALRLASRCDVIHAHDARSHTWGVLATVWGAPVPLVVARRVAFPPRSRWKYQRAARYIAVSEHVKAVLAAGGVREERIAVVYDGVPLLEPAVGDEVLAPATADPRKGAALAVEAARAAGAPLRLSDDLERDLLQAALLVYISYSEGLGSAALLAMSAGVPVIASNLGGLREIICHGRNGLVVENSVAAIAGAIRELRGNTAFARQLGEAARQTVAERFTCERMVRGTLDVYRQVMTPGSPERSGKPESPAAAPKG